ncbi:MAG: 30S ribosomal protein S9 [Weeksellaceae bacterium]
MVKKTKALKYYEAVGRRKESVARVRLYITAKDNTAAIADQTVKAGEILVNNALIDRLYPLNADKMRYMLPLTLTNAADRFAVSIRVSGGGKKGQLDAIMHGLSRALVLVDEENKSLLKTQGLMTRDSRKKERRKVGTGGKARRQKQSPKR